LASVKIGAPPVTSRPGGAFASAAHPMALPGVDDFSDEPHIGDLSGTCSTRPAR
jgi:hypothetical protein